ncbi:predicted protein [Nematostella vectensis]|uniref:Uncharacterized protein n=2 Tax=Nematostella vectensis TaxID=45351 RepID=A7SF33_NEMVE|nr:predicted protein [Nematostella vectensis]|eukprot:XP_001629768.1 predicted protein [Nematostella vectensis]
MAPSLDIDDVKELFCEESESKKKKRLAFLLGFDEFEEDDDLRSASLLDIYYCGLSFAVDEGFPWKNVCFVFETIKVLLEAVKDNSLPEAIKYFQDYLQRSNVQFTAHGMKSLVDFVFQTFFQHYRLYKFVLTCDREEDRTQFDLTVEPPQGIDKMTKAIPKSDWDEKERLKDIDKMEEERRKKRQEFYSQQLSEVAKHLEEPYMPLTSTTEPISKEQLNHIIKDVVNVQASVTETLLKETLDEMEDTLEYQYMRSTALGNQDDGKSPRKKSSSSKSRKAVS